MSLHLNLKVGLKKKHKDHVIFNNRRGPIDDQLTDVCARLT